MPFFRDRSALAGTTSDFVEACVARSSHTWSFFVSTLAVQNKDVIAKRFDYPTVVLFSGNTFYISCIFMFINATEEDYRRVVETFGYYIFVLNG